MLNDDSVKEQDQELDKEKDYQLGPSSGAEVKSNGACGSLKEDGGGSSFEEEDEISDSSEGAEEDSVSKSDEDIDPDYVDELLEQGE